MADDELQRWFRNLHFALMADMAQEWAAAVERILVDAIREAAPEGQTDHLKESVRKIQGVLNGDGLVIEQRGDADGSTQWVIVAGGPLTTKTIVHPHGKMQQYDYAIGTEWGTQHEPAEPFFWNTVRNQWPKLVAAAEQILKDRFAKLR